MWFEILDDKASEIERAGSALEIRQGEAGEIDGAGAIISQPEHENIRVEMIERHVNEMTAIGTEIVRPV